MSGNNGGLINTSDRSISIDVLMP